MSGRSRKGLLLVSVLTGLMSVPLLSIGWALVRAAKLHAATSGDRESFAGGMWVAGIGAIALGFGVFCALTASISYLFYRRQNAPEKLPPGDSNEI